MESCGIKVREKQRREKLIVGLNIMTWHWVESNELRNEYLITFNGDYHWNPFWDVFISYSIFSSLLISISLDFFFIILLAFICSSSREFIYIERSAKLYFCCHFICFCSIFPLLWQCRVRSVHLSTLKLHHCGLDFELCSCASFQTRFQYFFMHRRRISIEWRTIFFEFQAAFAALNHKIKSLCVTIGGALKRIQFVSNSDHICFYSFNTK